MLQAQAEGLTLLVADNKAGYFGVHLNQTSKSKPYTVQVSRGGKMVHLGSFATAEEAALAVARANVRTDAPAGSPCPVAAKRAAPLPKPPTAKANPKPVTISAKAEQTTCSRPDKRLVGKRISVFWAEEATWFSGSIREYNDTTEEHLVVYDDGDQRHEELHDPTLQWKLIASNAAPQPTQKAASVAARRTDAPAASPPPAAAKRAAPSSKLPLVKQPRSSLAPHCLQPVTLPNHAASASIALGTVAATAPAPRALFKDKLALVKRELGIEPTTPAIPAIAEANELMGITPSAGESLLAQLDNVIVELNTL